MAAKASSARYYGTGRRKAAIAKVHLVPGKGKLTVNGKNLQEYIGNREILTNYVKEPLEVAQVAKKFDVVADVMGGGIVGQMGAVRLGISRALLEADPENRKALKVEGMLTRDPRVKERKKYGRKKARKRFQFSKR